ncbi:MAG: hypothetical protein A3F96_00645 [Parcubacteria group bacterium RIFCSPLOWO2_12_FULL_40_10]|nr:MAG: hypothetical protein A3F96_00645 [Parcubacteria group bacterium RIFCSPLOWO2_12_FULL_40_10]
MSIRSYKRYGDKVKKRAEELRKGWKSYREIYEVFKIPKSTLSTWFGKKYPGVFDKKAQLNHLEKIRPLALKVLKKERERLDELLKKRVYQEIEEYPFNNIGFYKSILAILYWAEGGKYNNSPVNFANTDPKLAKLFITLLRKCYKVDEDKLRVRIHLHYYHNIKKSKKFWSSTLDVPISQFGKIYIKKRSKTKKFRKNFMGICFIRYHSNGMRKEIMELAY